MFQIPTLYTHAFYLDKTVCNTIYSRLWKYMTIQFIFYSRLIVGFKSFGNWISPDVLHVLFCVKIKHGKRDEKCIWIGNNWSWTGCSDAFIMFIQVIFINLTRFLSHNFLYKGRELILNFYKVIQIKIDYTTGDRWAVNELCYDWYNFDNTKFLPTVRY